MSADSLPGVGQVAPSGRPTPSSAMTTRQPPGSTVLCSVIVPPSRPGERVLERVRQQFVGHESRRHSDVNRAGQVSTLRSRRIPSTACALMTAEAISLR